MAAVLGFEPRQTESESAVLPLHNTAMFQVSLAGFEPNNDYYIRKKGKVKAFYKFFLRRKINPKLRAFSNLYGDSQRRAGNLFPEDSTAITGISCHVVPCQWETDMV